MCLGHTYILKVTIDSQYLLFCADCFVSPFLNFYLLFQSFPGIAKESITVSWCFSCTFSHKRSIYVKTWLACISYNIKTYFPTKKVVKYIKKFKDLYKCDATWFCNFRICFHVSVTHYNHTTLVPPPSVTAANPSIQCLFLIGQ